MGMSRRAGFAASLLTLLLLAPQAFADDLKTSLFRTAEEARATAAEVDARLLAPRTWVKAEKLFDRAEAAYGRNGNIERIRKDLVAAEQTYRVAIQKSEMARTALGSLIKTRSDALSARAPELYPDRWSEADERFKIAMVELERGDLKLAKRRSGEAETVIRQLELDAIKADLLTPTRTLIADAKRLRVHRTAPVTYARAQALLAEADKELTENRYDLDRPRALAREANYEARHAIYLAELITKMRESRQTVEQLVLELEEPFRQVAAAADIVAEFDEGFGKPADAVKTYIQDQEDRNAGLEADLAERTEQVYALEQEVTEALDRLGGVSEERSSLERRLAQQAIARQRFEEVERMFTRDEAQVLRQSGDVIIRLTGLSFDVGSAAVDLSNFELLKRVQTAILTFPESQVVVEGHTDAFGSDAANYSLSQQRAESVREHLANQMNLPATRLSSVGYGETRPVASNETREGRARNRRIEIIIRPSATMAAN